MGASPRADSASATLASIIRSHSLTAPVPVRIARIWPGAVLGEQRVPEPPVEHLALGPAGPVPGDRHQDRALALAQVIAGRLPGLRRIPEHAQNVVPQLERDAQRDPVAGEGGGHRLVAAPMRAGQGRAQVQRALDRVLGRLEPDHPQCAGHGAVPRRLAEQVQVLAGDDLHAHGVEHLLPAGQSGGRQAAGVEQLVGPGQQQIADQDGGPGAERLWPTRASRPTHVWPRTGGAPTAGRGGCRWRP